jgi:serine/threonine protein kinase/formylglycine-generating enzyme required for sulfatase activity
MDEERFWEILDAWEQSCQKGHELSPQELCRDAPELIVRVQESIAALRATKWLQPQSPVLPLLSSMLSPNPVQYRSHPAPETGAHTDTFPEATGLSAGRYKLVRPLGEGAFGRVWLGIDEELRRQVAIKVPHDKLLKSRDDADAYLHEARMIANLDHPNIVPVFDVGSSDQFPCYFVSRFIDGKDLARHLEESRLSLRASVELIITVADALHHAHSLGLVHRDIKPGNILLDKHGKPFISDFGLAMREEDFGKGPQFAGTPAYMSPEQARREGHRVDGRSDIFSLGVVLYELLVGRRPFRAESRDELMEQIINHDPRPLRQVDESIPRELDRICLKALSKRASERYPTARDFADDLRHFLADDQTQQSIGPHHPTRNIGSDSSGTHAVMDHHDRTHFGSAGVDGSTSQHTIRIIPKGLRSFDAHDADFFLELLPGPRDRNRLPDSIRIWKTRIEETDADNTFTVGLIYGASGCGKSSLVKAGLLPRLSDDIIVVYVEATAEETEKRLIVGLRKRCPTLPDDLNLKDAITELRRGRLLRPGQKLLIVLDQFEQWLHSQRGRSHTDLVQALRQCDGERVQCLILVRDDFWLAITRFFREIEIRLVEGRNCELADLFDEHHAQKVLYAFGRAFGKLPEEISELNTNQKEFLKQAVTGLATEGKVNCVRLALFAEMMKAKDWTPARLKEAGGTEGVGVTFLEETFSTASALPEHRYHQNAAREVLRALLPESGTNIKGHMRAESDLCQASGYARRPNDFNVVMRILDGELRLITPTDPEGQQEPDKVDQSLEPGQRFYQLAHDYLVQPLRTWLSRKQRETRRGRAELLLTEHTDLWVSKSERRILPGFLQWLSIVLWTKHSSWNVSQREMIRATTIRHGSVAGTLLGLSAIIATAFIVQRQSSTTANVQTLVEAVCHARPVELSYAVERLEPNRTLAVAKLREHLVDTKRPRDRLHAACALAVLSKPADVQQFLVDAVGSASDDECINLVTALRRYGEPAIEKLSDRAGAETDIEQRSRYSLVLLYLGRPDAVRQMLQFQANPEQRTRVIHDISTWHGDIHPVLQQLINSDDSAFRSGLCSGLGQIVPSSLPVDERDASIDVLRSLYVSAKDGATHSAAGWALRKWGEQPPVIKAQSTPEEGASWNVNSQGMVMIEIPPGTFTMGLNPGLTYQDPTDFEKAHQHQVTLTRPFMMSDREVTLGMYREFLVDPNASTADKPNWLAPSPQQRRVSPTAFHPMCGITWCDAVRFCNWLSRKEGRSPCYVIRQPEPTDRPPTMTLPIWTCDFDADGYRLPTEAEWEWSCRAGTSSVFSFGDDSDVLQEYACVMQSHAFPGGSFLPNSYGLFDMHGNVMEWCWDYFAPYSSDAQIDPRGPAQGNARVARGSMFWFRERGCPSGYRHSYDNFFHVQDDGIGFRLVCRSDNGRASKPLTHSAANRNFDDTEFGMLTVRLFNDLNGNGKVDPDHAHLPNAVVYLDHNQNGVLDFDDLARTTDATGNANFQQVLIGKHRLRLETYQVKSSSTGYVEIEIQPGVMKTVDLMATAP